MQGPVDWHHIHAQLTSLSKKKAELAAEEAHWLIEAERARVHQRLGYGSLPAYVAAVLGYSEREARERLMVAHRLEELPKTAEALAEGKLVWSGARELSRVATSDTEVAWLDRARDKNVRQIEKLVSGHSLGDLPDDPKERAAERHVPPLPPAPRPMLRGRWRHLCDLARGGEEGARRDRRQPLRGASAARHRAHRARGSQR